MNRNLIKIAKKLRNQTTDAEKILWQRLRCKELNYKFRRQQPIGNFIVDFICFEKKLIIEVDGGQHNESKADKERDMWLTKEGYSVVRFWNNEIIKNTEGVLEVILRKLPPSPDPSPQGRGVTR